MKKVIKIVEVNDEGLEGLLGQKVTLLCMNYFYTGILAGVNGTCVKLEEASIIYETDSWTTKKYKDIQKLPSDIYVQTAAIEAFGVLKG